MSKTYQKSGNLLRFLRGFFIWPGIFAPNKRSGGSRGDVTALAAGPTSAGPRQRKEKPTLDAIEQLQDWPDAAVGREDSIGAESSHSNKVIIRRLSYLDLLPIGRFLLLYAKGNSGGQQKRQPAGLEEMAKLVGIKNQGMREAKSLPFLWNDNKMKQTNKNKNKFPICQCPPVG